MSPESVRSQTRGSLNSQQVSSDQLQVTSYNPNESLPPLVDRLKINQCVCFSVCRIADVNIKYSQPFLNFQSLLRRGLAVSEVVIFEECIFSRENVNLLFRRSIERNGME